MFYADTPMFGGNGEFLSGAFFGADHVVFATDALFASIEATVKALGRLDLSAEERCRFLWAMPTGFSG